MRKPWQRGTVLNHMADVRNAHAGECAWIAMLSSGQSIHVSRRLDIGEQLIAYPSGSGRAVQWYASVRRGAGGAGRAFIENDMERKSEITRCGLIPVALPQAA